MFNESYLRVLHMFIIHLVFFICKNIEFTIRLEINEGTNSNLVFWGCLPPMDLTYHKSFRVTSKGWGVPIITSFLFWEHLGLHVLLNAKHDAFLKSVLLGGYDMGIVAIILIKVMKAI